MHARSHSRSWTRRAAGAALLVLALPGVAAADTSPAAGRITVGRNATVEGASVRLADVAVLEGNGSDFADVDLGAAPDPGGSRRLDGVAILRRLRAAGLDDVATRYEIPASVHIARAYQDVGTEEIRDAVERDAGTLLAAGEQLRGVNVAGAVRIPPGPYELRVAPPPAVEHATRRKV